MVRAVLFVVCALAAILALAKVYGLIFIEFTWKQTAYAGLMAWVAAGSWRLARRKVASAPTMLDQANETQRSSAE